MELRLGLAFGLYFLFLLGVIAVSGICNNSVDVVLRQNLLVLRDYDYVAARGAVK